MDIIILFSTIITILLLPFFTAGRPWIIKFIFLFLGVVLTPIIGIPLYLYFDRH